MIPLLRSISFLVLFFDEIAAKNLLVGLLARLSDAALQAEEWVLRDAIVLRHDLVQIDGQDKVDDCTNIDCEQTLVGLIIDLREILIAGIVSTVKSHIIEHANVGETRKEVPEPLHFLGNGPDCKIHSNGDCACPDRHCIPNDRGCLGIVDEDGEEKGERDLAKAPAKED